MNNYQYKMMPIMNTNSEKLYTKVLNILVKGSAANDERVLSLTLHLEWLRDSASSDKKVLAIHLTDTNDPFFYYLANIDEDDFYNLKRQQKLLVDFLSFSEMFTDLLQLCITEEKYVLCLYTEKKCDANRSAVLSIEEKNPFKEIVHLSLILPEVSTVIQKQYITSSYRKMKDNKERLEAKLLTAEKDLKRQLEDSNRRAAEKIAELENVIRIKTEEITHKEHKFKDEIRKLQDDITKKYEAEMRELEEAVEEKDKAYSKSLSLLQSKVNSLEGINREQYQKLENFEKNVKELRFQLHTAEEEIKTHGAEMEHSKNEISRLQGAIQEKKRAMNDLAAVNRKYENEFKSLKNKIATLDEEIVAIKDDKLAIERKCSKLEGILQNKESKLVELKQDIDKGNDIIRLLQDEQAQLLNKLKNKAKDFTKLKEVSLQKNEQYKSVKGELADMRNLLAEKEHEVEKLKKSLAIALKKLQQSEELVITKENILRQLDVMYQRNGLMPEYLTNPSDKNIPGQSSACAKNQITNEYYLDDKYLQRHQSIVSETIFENSLEGEKEKSYDLYDKPLPQVATTHSNFH